MCMAVGPLSLLPHRELTVSCAQILGTWTPILKFPRNSNLSFSPSQKHNFIMCPSAFPAEDLPLSCSEVSTGALQLCY